MSNYLLKYKGKYRILPELDKETNDMPREEDGTISSSYDDLYIACQNGNKIYHYGKSILVAYIPSLKRGKTISSTLIEEKIPFTNYLETDSEVEFRFNANHIERVAELMKAKTLGASISPFSTKNLPKKKVEIPLERIGLYREIIASVDKGDILIIKKINDSFLKDYLEKTIRKNSKDRKFDYRKDMKKMCLTRDTKAYIYEKGMWDEYLKYLKEQIETYKEAK